MSYVRWSSVIGSDVSMATILDEMRDGTLKSKDFTRRQLETPGSYQSKWYIFWHCGFDESGNQSKEEQLLAIWLAGQSHNTTLPYDEVKYMYENDDWHTLAYTELPQKELLRECVGQWLEDVESVEVDID